MMFEMMPLRSLFQNLKFLKSPLSRETDFKDDEVFLKILRSPMIIIGGLDEVVF